MTFQGRVRRRLAALLGLDFDFTVDLRRARFSQVSDSLVVGRRPRAHDLDELKSLEITHVISCLDEPKRDSLEPLHSSFRALFIPIRDGMHEDISLAFPAAFDFAQRSKATPGGKLLVHCEAGVSRSATIAIALMMKSSEAGFFETFERARQKRAEILPNIGFASHLQRLENVLLPERQTRTVRPRWRDTYARSATCLWRSNCCRARLSDMTTTR